MDRRVVGPQIMEGKYDMTTHCPLTDLKKAFDPREKHHTTLSLNLVYLN
jgi:hypothetical protein